ncbi:hypothetical protein HG530_010033 [Fusarium avenaceum]|nr:hypothetical protein HG530_010033 [Fusarium avenaceum]
MRFVIVEDFTQLSQVLLKIRCALEHIRSQLGAFLFQSDLFPTERHVEAHQVASVRRDDIRVLSHNIFGSSTHGRLDSLARRIEKKLGEPFENCLNMGCIWLLEICDGKVDSDVCNAAYDFAVREAHESISLLLLLPRARLLLRGRNNAHSWIQGTVAVETNGKCIT